jgi:hypothetical protein
VRVRSDCPGGSTTWQQNGNIPVGTVHPQMRSTFTFPRTDTTRTVVGVPVIAQVNLS